jgi:hypothetical protein
MGDNRGVALPAVNRLQDHDHQFWQFESAQVDMNRVRHLSSAGFVGCASAAHDDIAHQSDIGINWYHNA